jgi:hypothetical protein
MDLRCLSHKIVLSPEPGGQPVTHACVAAENLSCRGPALPVPYRHIYACLPG